jgi:hypothetical protein
VLHVKTLPNNVTLNETHRGKGFTSEIRGGVVCDASNEVQ